MLIKLLIFLLLSSTAWATDYTADSRCKLAYLFTEGSGTTTQDNSGNGNNGTFASAGNPGWSSSTVPTFGLGSSPTYSVSYPGAGFINGGTSDSVLLYNQAQTITFWMYATHSNIGHNIHVLGKEASSTSRVFVEYDANANGSTDLSFEVNGSTPLFVDASNTPVNLNTWYFIAITWDGSTTATNVHIYINNSEASYSVQTSGVSLLSNSGDTIGIGDRAGDGSKYFEGNIAQFGWFNAVLNSTDLTAIYNYGLKGTGTPVTAIGTINNATIRSATIN